MPAPVLAANDIVEVRYFCQQGAQIGINVRHFNVDNVGGASIALDKVASVESAIVSPLIQDLMSSNSQYLGLGARIIKPAKSLEYLSQTGLGPGVHPSGALPLLVAGIITLKTVLPGRKYRGRLYTSFPGEDMNTLNGVPNVTFLGPAANLGGHHTTPLLWEDMPGDNALVDGGVYHRSTNDITAFESFTVRSHWGTQRRRRQGSAGDVSPF